MYRALPIVGGLLIQVAVMRQGPDLGVEPRCEHGCEHGRVPVPVPMIIVLPRFAHSLQRERSQIREKIS